jgi:ankyrin repeat protein
VSAAGGPTPILAAVYRRQAAELAALLAAGPTLTLFEAAAVGDVAAVRAALARAPESLAGRSPDGWPALHLAAHFGRGDAADALLAARADVRAVSDNAQRNTALHAALAGQGDLRIVTALLRRGADVEARDAGGHTPLHIAAFGGNLALINVLLAHGGSAEARADDGRTALDIAEARGHHDVARRLRGEMP